MSTKHHIVGLVLCVAFVTASQYLGLVWSFADFHPGHIPDLPEDLHRRARIGHAMLLPFEQPWRWLAGSTGDYSPHVGSVLWLVLPLCYGSFIYFAIAFIRRLLSRANRKT
jgi:hypothetical protein